MKSATFQDAVESSTKVIGRKTAVNVVFEGDRAETDGDTVYIPALPPSAEISTKQADIIRGFRDHEALHIRCTSTDTATMAELADIQRDDPHLFGIVQYCEDTRIENAGIQEYSGMKHTLTATNVRAAEMLRNEMAEHGNVDDVFMSLRKDVRFRMALSTMSRNMIGVENDGILDGLMDVLEKNDKPMFDLAKKFAKEMANLPTGVKNGVLNEKVAKSHTKDSFDLAKRIAVEYRQLEQQQQQQQQQQGDSGNGDGANGDGQQGDQGQGQQGSGNAQGQGGGNGEQQQSQGQGAQGMGDQQGGDQQGQGGGKGQGQGKGKAGGGESGSGSGQQGGDGGQESQGGDGHGASANGGGGNGSGSHQTIADDAQRKLEDMMQNSAKTALSNVVGEVNNEKDLNHKSKPRKYLRATNKLKASVPALECVTLCHEGRLDRKEKFREQGKQAIEAIDKAITGKKAMIRRLLELELQARSDRRWNSGFTTGRLPAVRVVDAMAGRESVYQQRAEGKDMNTLLYISIDGSSSMTEGREYDPNNNSYGPSRMESSIALAYALSEALERTGCDIIVKAWGNRAVTKSMHPASSYTKVEIERFAESIGAQADSVGRMYARGDVAARRFTSLGLITRAIIKEKRQRTTDPNVRIAFGVATFTLNSSTPTYDAIFSDLEDLAREQHAKKIYLHITDGAPDRISHTNEFTPESLMKEAHDYAAGIGVHMIGVGIAGRKVSQMFTDYVEVDGADSYEPVVKKLAKLVAKESGHAATFKRAA